MVQFFIPSMCAKILKCFYAFFRQFLFPLRPMMITKFSTYNVNWKSPENGCLQQRRCNKPLRRVFFTSIPFFGHDVHRVIRYQWARFSKVSKLFGRNCIIGRPLEARNFSVTLIYIPYTTYEKTSFTK